MFLADFSWNSLFENLGPTLLVVFLFGGWVIVAVVRSFTCNWRKVREAEQTAALKQSMIERGMSAEDIERVLNAGAKPGNLTKD
jgi:hypothetical protein